MAEYETQVLTPYMNEYRTKVTPTKTATNLGAEPKPEEKPAEPSEEVKLLQSINEELKKTGNPADCVGCGNCQGHCPQGIKIIDMLKEVSSTFSC